jgi:NifB/MoaA-like Fe-S oxidoreductase
LIYSLIAELAKECNVSIVSNKAVKRDKAAEAALKKRLQEIEAALVPLDALLRGMDRQLITNRVVTNSTVNRNKSKRK